MTDRRPRPRTVHEAHEQGYREVGDLEAFRQRHAGLLAEDDVPGCNPPPPDNICLDTVMNGIHYIGYCVPGRGCVVYQQP